MLMGSHESSQERMQGETKTHGLTRWREYDI